MTVTIHEYDTDKLHLVGISSNLIQNTNILLNVTDVRLACLYLTVFQPESTVEGLKDAIKNTIYPMLVPFALNTSKAPVFEIANQKQVDAVLDAIPMQLLQKGELLGLDFYDSGREVRAAVVAEIIAESLTYFNITQYTAEFTIRDDSPKMGEHTDNKITLINETSQRQLENVKNKALKFSQNFYCLPSKKKGLESYFVSRDNEMHPDNFMHSVNFSAVVSGHSTNSGYEFTSEGLHESFEQARRLAKPEHDPSSPFNYTHAAIRLCLHMYTKKYLSHIAIPQARVLQKLLGEGGIVDYYTAGASWTTISTANDPLLEVMSTYRCDLAKASKTFGVLARYAAKASSVDTLKALPPIINQ